MIWEVFSNLSDSVIRRINVPVCRMEHLPVLWHLQDPGAGKELCWESHPAHGDLPLFLCYLHISYHPSAAPHSAEETQKTQRFWLLLLVCSWQQPFPGLGCRTPVERFLFVVLHKAGAPTHSLSLAFSTTQVSDQIGHITPICLLWNLADFMFVVSVFTRNTPKSRLST